jgi:protein-disulfide isomerase
MEDTRDMTDADGYLGTIEQKPVKVAAMSPVESDEEDLTRKQRREQARSERKAMEEAEAAGAARRKRLTQLSVVAGVVIVIIVVILIATGGGGKSAPPKLGSTTATKEASAVATLINGIPQKGNVLGSSTAPVTLQYFGDLECPICKEFTLGALPTVIQKWVRTGKLKIEYRSLETATREPEVFKTQQVAALAAGKQNKLWYFVETFYHEQGEEDSGYVNEKYLQGIAQQVPGLNLGTWTNDRSDNALEAQVTSDAQAANNAGFTGTPSFLLGKSGGTLSKYEFSSLTDASSFNGTMEKLLA